MYHHDIQYAGHAPTENMTVYNAFLHITSTERMSSSLIRTLCLKCCVNKCVCMRISQFPTDGNEEEKVRKGKGGETKRKGKNKQEVKEAKRIKDNVG